MKNLVLSNRKGKEVTTSLIISEVFGKDHKNVIRGIQELSISHEFRELNFELSSYLTSQGRQLPMYEITKDGFSILVMGYTGSKACEFKERFIAEFNKRDLMLNSDDFIMGRALQISAKRTRSLEEQLCIKDEQLQLTENTLLKQAPKVEYFNKVLLSENLIPTNIIAKQLGMTAIGLNKLLKKNGVIYLSGGVWVLYQKYQDKGYAGTKTHVYTDSTGNKRTEIHAYWTERGRQFILDIVNKFKAI
jgi:Rha family phage regulatory protein